MYSPLFRRSRKVSPKQLPQVMHLCFQTVTAVRERQYHSVSVSPLEFHPEAGEPALSICRQSAPAGRRVEQSFPSRRERAQERSAWATRRVCCLVRPAWDPTSPHPVIPQRSRGVQAGYCEMARVRSNLLRLPESRQPSLAMGLLQLLHLVLLHQGHAEIAEAKSPVAPLRESRNWPCSLMRGFPQNSAVNATSLRAYC